MIAIFYNPKSDEYYAKYLRSVFVNTRYEVGYVNQYGHKLVCLFYINEHKKLIACKSFWDYVDNRDTLKKRLINKLIKFLERSVKNE